MNRSLGRNWLRVQIERCYVSAIANFFGNCPFSVSFPLAFLTSDLEILLKGSRNDQKALYHRGDSSRTLGRAGGSLAVISGDMVSSWWLYDGKTQKGTVDSISHWADFRQLTLYHTYFGSFSTTSSQQGQHRTISTIRNAFTGHNLETLLQDIMEQILPPDIRSHLFFMVKTENLGFYENDVYLSFWATFVFSNFGL